MRMLFGLLAVTALIVAAPACDKKGGDKKGGDKAAAGDKKGGDKADDKKGGDKKGGEKAAGDAAKVKVDKGVDLATKTIRIGTLNDESGPAAVLGKPFAAGKRLLAKQVNAGGSGLLPEGWKIELVEEDHGYNPSKALQAFEKLKDKVLFIGTSFGTPNTLPLQPHLKRANLVAFPASLSSKMAENAFTPPLGPGYKHEAMRAMDWMVENAGGADKVKAGIVYQKDDYGADALAGLKAAAAKHKVTIVSEQGVAPTQKDMVAVVTKLKEAGVTHLYLATLPGQSGPVLGTAAKLQFMPVIVGGTPSWMDLFFSGKLLPAAVFAKFHWASGLPFLGEKVPNMDKMMEVYKKHGKAIYPRPDFYILASYVQGLIQMEIAKRAITKGDLTRAGFMAAMKELKEWNAGGMIQPVNLSTFPYATSVKTRILKPDFEAKTWKQVAGYAAPKALGDAAAAPAAKPAEGDAKKPAAEGDAKPAAEGDAKKPAAEGDAKKPAAEGDAKKPAEGDAKKDDAKKDDKAAGDAKKAEGDAKKDDAKAAPAKADDKKAAPAKK